MSESPQSTDPFNYFCFESNEETSIILNYLALNQVLTSTRVDEVITRIVLFVKDHMHRRQTEQFTIHLFCNGMVLRNMNQHRSFMLHFAQMFKVNFPKELNACYVHNSPSFFSSIYELLKPILPKASCEKIIIVKSKTSKQNSVNPLQQARPVNKVNTVQLLS